MTIALVCASHSPLIVCYARPPAAHDDVERAFTARAAAVRAFDPELVIVFGPDHYNGFFLKLMPSFCVGLSCRSVADIGGTAGDFDVPEATATALAEALHRDDVDIAVSRKMVVDHGFSQTMWKVLGGVDPFPVVPIFINAMTPPYVPFRRSRLMGEAVGRFIAGSGKRVLILGSGGMSHNPTRYYPPIGEGPPEVADYQLAGGEGGALDAEAWLDRLETMHLEGAEMLVSGKRTKKDIRLNPETDRRFLDAVTEGRLEAFDAWQPAELMETAGIGFLELHTWIAACAAHRAAGGSLPKEAIYAETLEYGIGFGMIDADLE